jgi:hypothetical protein
LRMRNSLRTARSVATLAFLAVVCLGCLSTGATAPRLIGDGKPILFIGNSYTYVNDLPGIVQALADSAGEKIAVETIAQPDFALVDHIAAGTAQREIAKGGWAFVVLQQGPSSVEVNRDTLRLAVKTLAPSITAAGAKPALFSAWPTSSRGVDYPRAIESYKLAAADVNGVFLPIAGAWLEAWKKDPSLPLYASDGLHASMMGTYLAAVVIYAKLLNRPATGLPAVLRLRSGSVVSVDAVTAKKLQEAAAAALTP